MGLKKSNLGALARLDDFLMSPLNQGHSRSAPGYAYGISQGIIEDDSQSELHPEANISQTHTPRNCGPNDAFDMVTRVHEEVAYCSHGTPSGKQKKNSFTCQPQFCSRTHLRLLKQTKFCWPFSCWQTTPILQNF